MKASYYFYKGKIKSLPKGIFFLIIFLILLLIPLLIIATTATLLIIKVFRSFIAGKSKESEVTYSDYEIVEDVKEKKHLH